MEPVVQPEPVYHECSNCFFAQKSYANNGFRAKEATFCRRYPPTEIGFTRVEPNWWCGEHQEK